MSPAELCRHFPLRELATERANSSGFARSVSVVSQNATSPVAFSANDGADRRKRCRRIVGCSRVIRNISYHVSVREPIDLFVSEPDNDFCLSGLPEAGYIITVPKSGEAKPSVSTAKCPSWVKLRRTRCEHMFSALPSNSDIARRSRHVSNVPKAEALDWTIILPLSQLGGLHGAQWSRSPDLKRIMEDQVTTAEFAKRRCDAHGR
jgi:hypothetical protein